MLLVMPENPLGTFIKNRRRQLGIASQRELAVKAGVSHGYIANLERGYDFTTGKQVNPSVEKLEQIARALRVTPEQLGAIARGVDLDIGVQFGSGQGQHGATESKSTETPKPWPLHDLSRTSTANEAAERGTESGNDLSKSNQPGEPSGNIGISKGDRGHILSLADMGPWRNLPVYRVSCGERILINDEPMEWASFPAIMARGSDGVLTVEGESMLGCGYKSGDLLFYERINGHRPKDGDKVIAEVNEGAVCKLYKRDADGEYLVSAPGETETFFCKVTEAVRLVGIVKGRYTLES